MKDTGKVVFNNIQKHCSSANGGEETCSADMHIIKNTISVVLNKSDGGKWVALDRNNHDNLFPLEIADKNSFDDWENGDESKLTICIPPTETKY
jgi:hypothetical protein